MLGHDILGSVAILQLAEKASAINSLTGIIHIQTSCWPQHQSLLESYNLMHKKALLELLEWVVYFT